MSVVIDAGYLPNFSPAPRQRLNNTKAAKATASTNYQDTEFFSYSDNYYFDAKVNIFAPYPKSAELSHNKFAIEQAFLNSIASQITEATLDVTAIAIDSPVFSFGIIGQTQKASADAKHKIMQKITQLQSVFYDDYAESLSVASTNGLLEFISTLSSPVVPSLTAESSGEIVATWKKAKNSVSIKFLNNKKFHYAMAIETDKGTVRPWGTSTKAVFFKKQPEAREIIEQGYSL